LTNTARISGGLSAATDIDLYQVTVASQSVVRFETFDSNGYDCVGVTGLMMGLVDAAGTTVLYAQAQGQGIGACPALTVNLAAGTYYLKLTGTAAQPYMLEAHFEANGGNEVEPNDTQATATAVAGADVYVFGGHQVATDSDFFTVTVPQGKSLRAEV